MGSGSVSLAALWEKQTMGYLLDHDWPVLLVDFGITSVGVWLGLSHGGVRVGRFCRALSVVASVLFFILVSGHLAGGLGAWMSLDLPHVFTMALVWIPVVVSPVVIAVIFAYRRLYAPRRPGEVEPMQSVSGCRGKSVSGKTLTIAGQAVPEGDETRHFRIVGSTGAGRGTAIREILAGGLTRGDRAVIADPDGEYLRRLYKPERGDVILNPFDPRAARWDLFAEIEQPHDADQLALALIPDTEGLDRNWRGCARTLMASVLRQLHCTGERDLRVLHWLLAMAPAVELRHLLEPTSAAPILARDNGKLFDSLRSMGSALMAPIEHLTRQISGRKVSVRKWIREGKGALFLPYRAREVATLRGLISAWARIAILEALGGEEMDRRLWFVVD
jgi:hypothetical protein